MANQTPSMRITLVWQAQFPAYSIFPFSTLIPRQPFEPSPWDQSSRMNNGKAQGSSSCLHWPTQRRSGHGWLRSHLAGCVPSALHWPGGQHRFKHEPTQPFLSLTWGAASTPGLCSPAHPGSSRAAQETCLESQAPQCSGGQPWGGLLGLLQRFCWSSPKERKLSRTEPLDVKEKHIFQGKEEELELCNPPSQMTLMEGCAFCGNLCWGHSPEAFPPSVALAMPCCLLPCFVAWSHCKSSSFFFQMLYKHSPTLKLRSVNWRTQHRVCPKDWLPDVFLNKATNLLSTSEHGSVSGFL